MCHDFETLQQKLDRNCYLTEKFSVFSVAVDLNPELSILANVLGSIRVLREIVIKMHNIYVSKYKIKVS